MPTISKAILLAVVLAFSASTNARTWTSTDGRTIEASLVEKGEDSVVLILENGAKVIVKQTQLSKEDIAYLTTVKAAESSDIVSIINKYPALAYKDESGRQLNDKYAGFAKIMTPTSAFNLCQLIRKKLPEDLKYWQEEAERASPDVKPPPRKKGESISEQLEKWREKTAKQKERKQIAKDHYKWLSSTLPAWLTEVEKAASM
jgi:hypothetical protein